MKSVPRWLLLVVAAALGFWLWHVCFPNPKTVIRNRLNKLAQLASYTTKEGDLARLANVERLSRYFAENVEVKLDVGGAGRHTFNTRQELMQAALAARGTVASIQAKFVDIKIEMNPASQSAAVDLTLQARIAGSDDQLIQELHFTMKKIDGDWVIARIEPVSPLRL